MSRVINFGAGPAKLPEEVLQQVQKELIQYGDSGISVMEMSHRSSHYDRIHNETIQDIKTILNVPDNYKILLMQGGGTLQFSAIPMNLIGRTGKADYLVTGSWSTKAAKEASKYGEINWVIPKQSKYTEVPDQKSWQLNPDASYVYYCDNETIDGVEFNFIPETNGVPLVCDMSSNFFSRNFDITKFALVFASAQKNIGPSGTAVVIVRDDFIGKTLPLTPIMLDYAVMAKDNSIHNTPATFVIYVMGLVFKWIIKNGGLNEMERLALSKSNMIYDVIADSKGFYYAPVHACFRSKMNVPFRIGGEFGDTTLEKEFLIGAESLGMTQLKGHRSVGGIRASLYNAVTVEETSILVKYMKEFAGKNKERIQN